MELCLGANIVQIYRGLYHKASRIIVHTAFVIHVGTQQLPICVQAVNYNHYIFLSLDGDKSNYLTYFKRAAVLLALGRSKSALPDLERVIELRPDFLKV